MHLFTYGTLMHPEIWSNVVKGDYEFETFEIHGFERRALRERAYPGLIRKEGSKVSGVLYKSISEYDMELLDHFEGEEYTRIKLLPLDEIPVFTYLYTFDEKFVLQEPWNYGDFIKRNFQNFRAEYKGWEK